MLISQIDDNASETASEVSGVQKAKALCFDLYGELADLTRRLESTKNQIRALESWIQSETTDNPDNQELT